MTSQTSSIVLQIKMTKIINGLRKTVKSYIIFLNINWQDSFDQKYLHDHSSDHFSDCLKFPLFKQLYHSELLVIIMFPWTKKRADHASKVYSRPTTSCHRPVALTWLDFIRLEGQVTLTSTVPPTFEPKGLECSGWLGERRCHALQLMEPQSNLRRKWSLINAMQVWCCHA